MNDPIPFYNILLHYVALTTMSLPVLSLVVCLMMAMALNYDAAVSTHCNVYNILPTVSASINYPPQKYIWRFCIGLHSWPRYFFTFLYNSYFTKYRPYLPRNHPIFYAIIVKLTWYCTIIEITALMILTCIGSTEYYPAHMNATIAFLSCSLLGMIMTYLIFRWPRDSVTLPAKWFISTRRKLYLLTNFGFFFACSIYLYERHNKYCEPMTLTVSSVYSYFAFCEYVLILTNIAFHATIFIDLEGLSLMVTKLPGRGGIV
ncbi:Post-GPI attachment to proteins factor 2 [Trichoplax sp. H2]|nr:Post-GPI attachment to proteins factor 2 [Trichoplax sp. H2]|eukprot:RDD39221.1 Post-GPI attachment to proteins factor 2 [Trichoplax sp. H2]